LQEVKALFIKFGAIDSVRFRCAVSILFSSSQVH